MAALRAPWSKDAATGSEWSGGCPHGSRPTIEECVACEIGCPSAADLGVERTDDASALEQLRSRLSILVRPA